MLWLPDSERGCVEGNAGKGVNIMDDKQKHYKFIPCKTDDLGMKLEWENESDAPTDGDWNWWMDKDGNVEFARMKEDTYDHFYPSTKHLNLHGTDWEPQSLSGYFKKEE